MKIKIIVDGACGLSPEEIKKYDLGYIPLYSIIEDKKIASNDENLAKLLYEGFKANKNLSTSQPSKGDILKVVEKYKEYDLLVFLSVSSKLSKTYDNLLNTTKDYNNVLVFDSYNGDTVIYEMVTKLNKLIKNKKPSKEEVLKLLNTIRKQNNKKQFLILDDLKPIVKSGRLKPSLAFIAKLMQIKPILAFDNGEIINFAKVRSTKRAIQKCLKNLAEDIDQIDKVVVSHFFAKDEIIEILKKQVKEILNKPLEIRKFSPLVATHTGVGTITIARFLKN